MGRGPNPILDEWCTRAHRSAISAVSPEGHLHFHCQDRSTNSTAVVALLKHLLGEVPGRLASLWDTPLSHRNRLVQGFLAKGAGQRLRVERLPAYASELNPGKGLCTHLKGIERRNMCGFALQHLQAELRDAIQRVRRKPRVIRDFLCRALAV
jgi:transposase